MMAKRLYALHNGSMPAITIRDIPDEARAELAARAARSGRSMQEYLKAKLLELAETPDLDEVLARIARRKEVTGTRLSADRIIELRDADRR